MPDSSGAEWLEIFSPPVNNTWTIHLKQQRLSPLPSSKLKQIGSNLTCSDQDIQLQMKGNMQMAGYDCLWIYVYTILCKLKLIWTAICSSLSLWTVQKSMKYYFCFSKHRCSLRAQFKTTALPNCADNMEKLQVTFLETLKCSKRFQVPVSTSTPKFQHSSRW